MSGGYFDYKQWWIDHIADEIEQLIKTNNTPDEWGDARNYSGETIERFNIAVALLRNAAIYAQRIDWLVSGDDSEETFHKRLLEDLYNIKPTLQQGR